MISPRQFSSLFTFTRNLLITFALLGSLHAGPFPRISIPESERVLTVQEVKNFWVNSVKNAPIPKEPSVLREDEHREWQASIQKRRAFIAAVKAGTHHQRAKIAQLEHNIIAHTKLGQNEAAQSLTQQLHALREHIETIKTLEAQRKAALAQAKLAEQKMHERQQLAELEAQLAALRHKCNVICEEH